MQLSYCLRSSLIRQTSCEAPGSEFNTASEPRGLHVKKQFEVE
jgi:hypothetical protein